LPTVPMGKRDVSDKEYFKVVVDVTEEKRTSIGIRR